MKAIALLHRKNSAARGFTLLELVVAATILSILTLMALPMARLTMFVSLGRPHRITRRGSG
jgi:prepilin-type N-terminal cleavage/methylation domain-containing protein